MCERRAIFLPSWNLEFFLSAKQMGEEKGKSTDVDDVGVMRMEEGQEPRQSLELNRTGPYVSVLVQLLRLFPKDFPLLTTILRLVGKIKSTSSGGSFYIFTPSLDISHPTSFFLSTSRWQLEAQKKIILLKWQELLVSISITSSDHSTASHVT